MGEPDSWSVQEWEEPDSWSVHEWEELVSLVCVRTSTSAYWWAGLNVFVCSSGNRTPGSQ